MKPYYHEASRLMKELDDFKPETPVLFAKVDGAAENYLVKKNAISSYPTIIIIRKYQGEKHKYEYEGPRQKSGGIFLL